jgi:hypothetical protein
MGVRQAATSGMLDSRGIKYTKGCFQGRVRWLADMKSRIIAASFHELEFRCLAGLMGEVQ